MSVLKIFEGIIKVSSIISTDDCHTFYFEISIIYMKYMFYDVRNYISGHLLFVYLLILKQKLVSQPKMNEESLTYQLYENGKHFYINEKDPLFHYSALMTE